MSTKFWGFGPFHKNIKHSYLQKIVTLRYIMWQMAYTSMWADLPISDLVPRLSWGGGGEREPGNHCLYMCLIFVAFYVINI